MFSLVRDFIKSPLNYIGGKYSLLSQIVPLFPSNIRCFVDLFAGGLNVCLNVPAKSIIANDNLTYLVDFYKALQNTSLSSVLDYVYQRIEKYELSLQNEEGYKALREYYNSHRNPFDLFVLVSYSFNHQIRFNNTHKFNNPFGRNRSRYNAVIEENLKAFIRRIQECDIKFRAGNFADWDLSFLQNDDFVYCDPPYLISTGSYNDGRRGFSGWGDHDEIALLEILDNLHKQGVYFALSNILSHKGTVNRILEEWLVSNAYYVIKIKKDYSNSNYQTKIRNKKATQEVLITNYDPVVQLGYFFPLFQQA